LEGGRFGNYDGHHPRDWIKASGSSPRKLITTVMTQTPRLHRTFWKFVPWAVGVAIMLAPLIAMQFTHEVAWDGADFAVLGVMVFGSAGAFSLASRITPERSYLAGIGLALLATFALIWINLAVGIIGSEDNPTNRIFSLILAVALIGALVARFKPEGMARAMAATAIAQMAVSVILFATGKGATFILAGLSMGLWLGAAWLFRRAAVSARPTQP